jgi:NAD(P)-dependent dehydrogenase (short-subunit alcohol dehydrogenase family)
VNNLGIYEAKPFSEITDDEWLRVFEINVMSGVCLSRFYLPGMLKRNWAGLFSSPAGSAQVRAFCAPVRFFIGYPH